MAKSAATTEKSEATRDYWAESVARFNEALGDFLRSPTLPKPSRKYDQMAVLSAWSDVMKGVFTQPEKLIQTQMNAMDSWSRLWANMWKPQDEAEPVVLPERGDRRFADEKWESSACFRQMKQGYLLAGKQLRELVQSSTEPDKSKRALAELLVEQYLNAVAPTNFAFTNPAVINRTLETKGANLVAGFANLLADMSEGRGIVRRRTDKGAFRLGENIAATPGMVVYQNDLMQLIQYSPATDKVRKRPMLYVPPLVNKYYMIDLQPSSSLIKWLVDQGNTVFVVSWVDPDEGHAHCEVADYVGRGVIEAMDQVMKATGEKSVDLFGFCMGGTLISMAAAVLAARDENAKIGSITLIGALIDFTDMMEWSAFVNEAQVEALDVHVGEKGYIDKDELQQLFSMMRANDLIWSSWVNHYLLDKEAPPSDLLFWFEHGSHIPQAFLTSYNRDLLVKNHLRVPGQVTLLDEKLDLTRVTAPITIIGLKNDHVSAWTSVYQGHHYFGGPITFVLGGSGHNAGVINPPHRNKHGYWLNKELPATADEWLAGATKHEGSWWPFWNEWLAKQDKGEPVAAREPGCGKLKPIEPAPGTYVLSGIEQ